MPKKPGPYKPPQVRAALIKSIENGSSVFAACKAAKISRNTFYEWYKEIPSFAKQVDEAKLAQVEIIEDATFVAAKNPKGPPVLKMFWLGNRAPEKWKNVNKVEAELHGQGPIHFVLYDPDKHAKPSEPGKPA